MVGEKYVINWKNLAAYISPGNLEYGEIHTIGSILINIAIKMQNKRLLPLSGSFIQDDAKQTGVDKNSERTLKRLIKEKVLTQVKEKEEED